MTKTRFFGVRLSTGDFDRLKALATDAELTEADTLRALIRNAQAVRPVSVVFKAAETQHAVSDDLVAA